MFGCWIQNSNVFRGKMFGTKSRDCFYLIWVCLTLVSISDNKGKSQSWNYFCFKRIGRLSFTWASDGLIILLLSWTVHASQWRYSTNRDATSWKIQGELHGKALRRYVQYHISSDYTGFVISKTKKNQRLSKIFSAYFQRLFKDLWEQSAVEKLRV
jgi:hypothetical protein